MTSRDTRTVVREGNTSVRRTWGPRTRPASCRRRRRRAQLSPARLVLPDHRPSVVPVPVVCTFTNSFCVKISVCINSQLGV